MIRHRVFIVGCPRSGTTLVQAILASLQGVFSVPETHFFSRLYGPGNRFVRCYDAQKALSRIADEHDWLAPFHPRPCLSRRTTVRRFRHWMDSQALSSNCDIWVEKTPLHIREIDNIRWHEGFADARFVHVIRNMQDTVRSLMQVGPLWGWPLSIDEAIASWVDLVGLSFHYLGDERHYLVEYDRLLSDPIRECQRLCDFVAVSFSPDRLQTLDETSRILVNASEKGWKGRNLGLKNIVRNNEVNRLNNADQKRLDLANRILLSQLGDYRE